MAEKTPFNSFVYPSELEYPFYSSAKGNFLAVDAGVWANAENGNLIFNGGGLVSWNALASTLTWTTPIYITPFTSATQAKAIIAGPPFPGGSIKLEDGEVAFFEMPRSMNQDTAISLTVGTRIYQPSGAKMFNLRLFAARLGDTILFAGGKSLKDGESAVLFGGGLGTTIPPHQHRAALVIEPAPAQVTLDLQVTSLGDEKLVLFGTTGILATGSIITSSVTSTTATVTAVNPTSVTVTSVVGPGFQIGETVTENVVIDNILIAAPVGVFSVGDTVTAGGATGVIRQTTGIGPTSMLVAVTAGIFPVIGPLVDSTSGATATITNTILIGFTTASIASVIPPSNLLKAEVFRNGMLLTEGVGKDYTLDYTTGILTLTLPTIASERFVILEETIPSGGANTLHQHLRLPIPIVINGTVNLDMQLTINMPSPTKLLAVDLYRNGALQSDPGDYSLDLNTGIVTLVIPALAGENFVAIREVV